MCEQKRKWTCKISIIVDALTENVTFVFYEYLTHESALYKTYSFYLNSLIR